MKNNAGINVFGYENKLVFPIYISDQKFEDSMDLLLLIDDDKSHYVYIKDFDRFIFHKTKHKKKKWFCWSCLQCFISESVLIKHKEHCLSINGKQSVKLGKWLTLRSVECYEGSYTKRYSFVVPNIPCSFAFKTVCADDRFTKPIVAYRGKNAAYEFTKAILKDYKYCKKIINKHFNKNLIMSEKEEHLFQESNSCWICKKLIDNDEEKVRDHCHVTGKFRGAAHWNCNINFQLTKKVPVIFHNLRGYDSHLIFNELDKFDVKISVIPNGLEKYMAFFWIKT